MIEPWICTVKGVGTPSQAWMTMLEVVPYDTEGQPVVYDGEYEISWSFNCGSGAEVRVNLNDTIIGEGSSPLPELAEDERYSSKPNAIDGQRVMHLCGVQTFKLELRASIDNYVAGVDSITLSVREHNGTTTGETVKCSQKGWCRHMRTRLQDANVRKKGLSLLVVSSDDKDNRVIGVVYKTDAHDRGMMLNVCPWCAEPILWE